jgi:ATPase subunit of ABC transporter with duplicated ATPase domains
MLKGELQPAGGHINFLQGKNVVTFSPTVGKKDHALSVSEFLAQHSASPEAVKEVSLTLSDLDLSIS